MWLVDFCVEISQKNRSQNLCCSAGGWDFLAVEELDHQGTRARGVCQETSTRTSLFFFDSVNKVLMAKWLRQTLYVYFVCFLILLCKFQVGNTYSIFCPLKSPHTNIGDLKGKINPIERQGHCRRCSSHNAQLVFVSCLRDSSRYSR